MRTTLEIDDELLEIARSRARHQGTSLGAAVSALIRQGLRSDSETGPSGFRVFRAPAGAHLVTDELVARYRDDPA